MSADTRPPTPRPAFVKDDHLTFLDELRESGISNMFGAAPFLAKTYGISKTEARRVLGYWMESYNERHPK